MGLISNLAYGVLASWPVLPLRRRLARSGITVFMYHDIGDDRTDIDVWQIVRRTDFLRQVDYLRKHYTLIDLEQALREIHSPRSDKPYAVLTFDDGHRGNIEHLLPIVQQEQLPVTLYIATGHVDTGKPYWFDRIVNHLQSNQAIDLDLRDVGLEHYRFNETRGAANWARMQKLLMAIKRLPADRCDPVTEQIVKRLPQKGKQAMVPLTPEEVGALSKISGITIGAHTDGHEVLTNVDLSVAEESIRQSVIKLQKWTGTAPKHFAYPAGYHNEALQELICKMGFASAMSTDSGIWRPQHGLFRIPRISVGRYDTLNKFMVNALER
ncbi:polysaccharide deacetylase family protein [Aquabacterium sp.]|uniref:polysaccharide deacetylase family protein n=1 Tax=Aquabacterium sp. TaxID=1872578 RepID=UPI002E37F8C1|nr:polysaccharide deacetylase family protein [Aquabacterium sp.]HEX5311186.1 polysaccharide deacetylase family protein [Aquabacterium sp.]